MTGCTVGVPPCGATPTRRYLHHGGYVCEEHARILRLPWKSPRDKDSVALATTAVVEKP